MLEAVYGAFSREEPGTAQASTEPERSWILLRIEAEKGLRPCRIIGCAPSFSTPRSTDLSIITTELESDREVAKVCTIHPSTPQPAALLDRLESRRGVVHVVPKRGANRNPNTLVR